MADVFTLHECVNVDFCRSHLSHLFQGPVFVEVEIQSRPGPRVHTHFEQVFLVLDRWSMVFGSALISSVSNCMCVCGRGNDAFRVRTGAAITPWVTWDSTQVQT